MKTFLKQSVSILFILLTSLTFSKAQGYEIKINISDLPDKEIYLGYYYGDKTYVRDTVLLNQQGKGVFKADTLLPQGVYIVVLPSKNYFDILLGEDQQFAIETQSEQIMQNMKIKGSEINEAFKRYQEMMMNSNKKSSELQSRLNELENSPDSAQWIRKELEQMSTEVKQRIDELMKDYAGTILSVVIQVVKNPEIPEADIPEEASNPDSLRWFHAYNYNRKHYFDFIDFNDERFLYTPVFHNKLNTYFTKILIQDPDTINRYIDMVASRALGNEEMFQYVMRYFINTFQRSNIMGMDKVFVHVADNYYLTDKVDWIDEKTNERIKEQVAKLRFNLIGNKAQELKMETNTGTYASLYDIDSRFTIVYFFEPNCGHCKKVTPKIQEIYNDFDRSEVDVFAVYTQRDKEEWSNYINNNQLAWHNVWDPNNMTNFRFFYNIYSTPTIYLLDKDKKIIAKRIGHESVRKIIEMELAKEHK
ncbi:MAG: thioredoxin-like domain-containing protein [Bacteroidales bacterium]|jgi:thiol-disulfide isomerase/thioredoxin|nr:thioredoxin-like domain-containing protein [Bacteroidales bacterium]